VAPGITIRDRLRVLLPSDPDNYYRLRDIVPAERVADLGRAKIVISEFHAFQLREKVKAPKLTEELAGERPAVFTETVDEMVRRSRACAPRSVAPSPEEPRRRFTTRLFTADRAILVHLCHTPARGWAL
jgi:hypothetical protein